jgi:hypothetical protein
MEIRITNIEFHDEAKAAVIQALTSLIESAKSTLELDSLELIVVPNDFGNELIRFQEEHGLHKGYTNNGLGLAVAKVMSYIRNKELVCSIFLNPHIVASLFDEGSSQDAIHIIHHELCHVHDDALKFKVFGTDDVERLFFETNDRVSQVSYAHADLIWSEYIATKLSISSKPANHHMYINSLIDAIPVTLNRCKEAKDLYQTHLDVGRLFGDIQEHLSYLFKTYAYLLGYYHAFSDVDEFEEQKMLEAIIETAPYLDGVFDLLPSELKKLHEIYGKWADHHVFKATADIVLRSWNNVGIYPNNTPDGQLYIGVTYN